MSSLRIAAARRKRSASVPTEGKGTGTRRVLTAKDVSPLILIVDDVEDNRALYAEFLTFSGLRVGQAVDGAHALIEVRRLLPNLVVMDLAMPILDGWDAIRLIKGHHTMMHIPIIAITGHTHEDNLRRAHEAGADAVLTKPCEPTALLAVIRKLLAGAANDSM
jgi:two-component system, cell cycle response regulator DivK